MASEHGEPQQQPPPPPDGSGPSADADGDPGTVPPPPAPSGSSAPADGPPPAESGSRDHPGPSLGGRLHPAAVAVNGLGQLLPLLFLLFAGPFAVPAVIGVGSLGFLAAAAQWWRFEWRVQEDALVIEQGLLQRKRRVIPIGRIQSVETVRKLRHRLLGVTALRVESVGGDDSEGRLEALDPELAEQVRRVLLRMAPAAPAEAQGREEAGEELVHLDFGQLVIAGVTGGRVGVAAAILGFGQELWLDPLLDSRFFDQVTRSVIIIAVAVGIGAVALFVLSVLATALVFWDFRLTHLGDRLSVRRGLLEQRADTIPLERIQAVRVEENLLRRLFGLAAVKIEVAGRAGSSQSTGQTDVVMPIGSRAAALRLADHLLDARVAATDLTPMPAAARTRRLVRAAMVTAVALVPTVIDARLLWLGLVAVPAVALALASYRALGWHTVDDLVLARSGVLVRRLWVVPATAVQSAQLSSTPFQRRRKLASLSLEIARSGNAGDPTLVDLGDQDARGLLHDAAAHSTEAGRQQVDDRRRRLATRAA